MAGDKMKITEENKERFQTIVGGTGSVDPNEWNEFFDQWNETTAFLDENPSVVADEALVKKMKAVINRVARLRKNL
jgi:L-ribulose-5-phosphate 3-epimerase UlaE